MKGFVAAVAAALTVVPFSFVVFVGVLLGGGENDRQNQTTVTSACVTWDGEPPLSLDLDDRQLDRAATIYSAAKQSGLGAQAATIGIATAMQESTLGRNPTAMTTPNRDGDIGLFQQRSLVGWYADGATQEENIAILLDDHYQAMNFFNGHDALNGSHIPGLRDIAGWRDMTLTQAAQAVQRSAFPDAYAKWESMAITLVNTFEGNPDGVVLCGHLDANLDCPPTGAPSEQGQTPDALLVMRCVNARWADHIGALLGVRPGDPRDHGTGRAVDIMISNYRTDAAITTGWEIANWLKDNAAQLGITYIIWREQIWSVQHDAKGWRSCAGGTCYTGPNDSASHRDHIHVSVHGNAATGFNSTNPTSSEATLPISKGSYRLTARYGDRGPRWSKGWHTGLDFAAPTGTPLYAVVDGTIIAATTDGGAYGYLTKLETPDGIVLYYAHQSHIAVTTGQKVTAGTQIGKVGNTGNSFGAHLHLEVRIGGSTVDPQTWLRGQGLNP